MILGALVDVNGSFMDEHRGTKTVDLSNHSSLPICGINDGKVLRRCAAQRNIHRRVVLTHPIPAILYFTQDHLIYQKVQNFSRVYLAKSTPRHKRQFESSALEVGN